MEEEGAKYWSFWAGQAVFGPQRRSLLGAGDTFNCRDSTQNSSHGVKSPWGLYSGMEPLLVWAWGSSSGIALAGEGSPGVLRDNHEHLPCLYASSIPQGGPGRGTSLPVFHLISFS